MAETTVVKDSPSVNLMGRALAILTALDAPGPTILLGEHCNAFIRTEALACEWDFEIPVSLELRENGMLIHFLKEAYWLSECEIEHHENTVTITTPWDARYRGAWSVPAAAYERLAELRERLEVAA